MMKIKKDYNLKIVLLITGSMFLLNSVAYGIDLTNKIYLRVPVGDEKTLHRVRDEMNKAQDRLDTNVIESDKLEEVFPELKKFSESLLIYRPALHEMWQRKDLPDINNNYLKGNYRLWKNVIEIAIKFQDAREQWIYYTNIISGAVKMLNYDLGLIDEFLRAIKDMPAEKINNFVFGDLKNAVKDCHQDKRRIGQYLRKEPMVFGGFVVDKKPVYLNIEKLDFNLNQDAWGKLGKNSFWVGYFPFEAQAEIMSFLNTVEQQGKLGNMILDVGSGINPQVPFYYNTKNTIIGVDPSLEKSFERPHAAYAPTMLIKGDIHNLDSALKQEEVYSFMAKAHGPTSTAFSSVVFIDSLNYVDYQYVLKDVVRYLKPGGRIVIVNMAGAGLEGLFNKNGVKSNAELLKFLVKIGLEIEYKHNPEKDVGYRATKDRQFIVAKKPGNFFNLNKIQSFGFNLLESIIDQSKTPLSDL